eukprot:gnl/TRDRNA2_/TRDRNA2_126030_c0_seq1.p1 gnl/TRDRNA2_/TRDRNA2_126030_c0~~gnl/TRDRNA2_/TRDRNA2_126030_c0_seq1.p1  ORF type:complete len:468 (+),score=86.23 gnl/TRDRNA2_/TRDRNA2_126030_c0_seq1:81-1484(+)
MATSKAAACDGFIEHISADLTRTSYTGEACSPRFSRLGERADIKTLFQCAVWLYALCGSMENTLMWVALLLVVSRREVCSTAVDLIRQSAEDSDPYMCTLERANSIHEELSKRFYVRETRWDTRRPAGGLERWAMLLKRGWPEISQLAKSLVATGPGSWTIATVHEAVPQNMVVYRFVDEAGKSYHRGGLLRCVTQLPPAFGFAKPPSAKGDWLLLKFLFPGTGAGAIALGIDNIEDATRVVDAVSTRVKELAPERLQEPYNVLDLSCALCMRFYREYHKDEGRDSAIRQLMERGAAPPKKSAAKCAKQRPAAARSGGKKGQPEGEKKGQHGVEGPPADATAAAAWAKALPLHRKEDLVQIGDIVRCKHCRAEEPRRAGKICTTACPQFLLSTDLSTRTFERRYIKQLRGDGCEDWVAGKLREIWLSHAAADGAGAGGAAASGAAGGVPRKRCRSAGGTQPQKRAKK